MKKETIQSTSMHSYHKTLHEERIDIKHENKTKYLTTTIYHIVSDTWIHTSIHFNKLSLIKSLIYKINTAILEQNKVVENATTVIARVLYRCRR